MQSALSLAAKSFQIIILTCRLRDWQNLQATTFNLEDCAISPAVWGSATAAAFLPNGGAASSASMS
jgi:hypothetical protein